MLNSAAPAEAATGAGPGTYVLEVALSAYRLTAPDGTATSTADPTAAVQSAVDALAGSGGAIILRAGMYAWTSAVRLPHDLPAPLRIIGEGGAVIKLSSAAPRAFDFAQTADHQTFRNIEIGWLGVDAGGAGGISQHVLIGTTTTSNSSGYLKRLNVEDLYLHDLAAYNIPAVESQTGFRRAIALVLYQDAAGETQQNWARRVTVERVQVSGGNVAVSVIGTGSTDPGLNLFIDEITFLDCRHDTGLVPSTGPWGASFQVGGRGFGGKVRIARCYSRGTGDSAFQINAMTDAVVEGCLAEEAFGFAFYLTNYRAPAQSGQRVTWRDCSVIRRHAGRGYGFRCNYNAGIPLGHVSVENCHYYRNTPDLNCVGEVVLFNAPMASASVRGLTAAFDGINASGSAATSASLLGTGTAASIRHLTLRDIHVSMQGANAGSGSVAFPVVTLSGSQDFTIENVRVDGSLSNWGSDPVTIVQLGKYSGSRLNGLVGNVRGTLAGAPLQHVWVGAATTLSVPNRIRVSDIDAAASAPQDAVFFSDSVNRANVFLDNVLTGGLQPSVVAVGTSPFTYQNTSGRTQSLVVGGSTVSNIELSCDGRTFAATAASQGVFTLANNSAVRVTYGAATPTLTAVPWP